MGLDDPWGPFPYDFGKPRLSITYLIDDDQVWKITRNITMYITSFYVYHIYVFTILNQYIMILIITISLSFGVPKKIERLDGWGMPTETLEARCPSGKHPASEEMANKRKMWWMSWLNNYIYIYILNDIYDIIYIMTLIFNIYNDNHLWPSWH